MVVERPRVDACAGLRVLLHLLHLLTSRASCRSEVRGRPRSDVERRTRGKRAAGRPDRIATCHRNCLPPKGRLPAVPLLRRAGHSKRGRPDSGGIEQNGTEGFATPALKEGTPPEHTQGDRSATVRGLKVSAVKRQAHGFRFRRSESFSWWRASSVCSSRRLCVPFTTPCW